VITSPLINLGKKKLRWFYETLKEANKYVGEPMRLMRESRVPERLGSYLVMVKNIIDAEPKTFSQAFEQHFWREAMQEE
jgi:hypothetical protein